MSMEDKRVQQLRDDCHQMEKHVEAMQEYDEEFRQMAKSLGLWEEYSHAMDGTEIATDEFLKAYDKKNQIASQIHELLKAKWEQEKKK